MEQHNEHQEQEVMRDAVAKEEKREWMLPASILAAAVMISVAFIYATGNRAQQAPQGQQLVAQQEVKKAPAVSSDEAVLGKADAKATIIEYGDFQCPYCVLFYKTFEPTIRRELIDTGVANYVFRPFPIVDQIAGRGTESVDSARAALCARDQGKFWDMHNGLYDAEAKEIALVQAKKLESSEANGNLNKSLFVSIAKNAGMDVAAFTTCYVSDKHKDTLAAFEQGASSAGVQGTPSLFVNGIAVDMGLYGTPDKFVQYVKSIAK